MQIYIVFLFRQHQVGLCCYNTVNLVIPSDKKINKSKQKTKTKKKSHSLPIVNKKQKKKKLK